MFNLIAGPAIAIAAPDSTPLGSAARATATLSGGDPTGSIAFQVFEAGDSACARALSHGRCRGRRRRRLCEPGFTAAEAGAYKWVARYNGDDLHAAARHRMQRSGRIVRGRGAAAGASSFGAAEIAVGESTSLTFTINNPSANTVPLAGVALEDTLPPGLVVASPNGLSGSCGAGTITAAPGTQDVTLVDGTVAVGSSCSFSVRRDRLGSGLGDAYHGRCALGERRHRQHCDRVAHRARSRRSPRRTPRPSRAPAPPIAPSYADRSAADRTGLASRALRRTSRLLARDRGGAPRALPRRRRPGDVGRQVTIRTSPGRVAARAGVRPDGSFDATGPRPRQACAQRDALLRRARRAPLAVAQATRRLTGAPDGRAPTPSRSAAA